MRIMMDMTIKAAAEPTTHEDAREVLLAARRGDRSVLPVLRGLIDANPHVRQYLGDLAPHVSRAWIDLAAGTDLALAEAIARKIQALKAELAGPASTPLERLLVDRVAAGRLQVHHAEAMLCRAKDRSLTLAQFDHFRRRIERAQRSHLASVKTLATIRKLLSASPRPPVIAGPECHAKPLRRGAKAARRGGPAKSDDEASKVVANGAAKGRRKPPSAGNVKGPRGAVISEPLRASPRGFVESEN